MTPAANRRGESRLPSRRISFSSPRFRGSGTRQILACLCLLAVSFALYSPSLGFSFQFDDQLFLQDSNVQHGNWRALSWPPAPRFLTWLTFLAQYQWSGPDAAWFRLFDLALHSLNALLVFLLLQHLLARFNGKPGIRLIPALAGALWFATHPVQIESVVYVYQRSTLLAASLAFAATWVWLRRRDEQKLPVVLAGVLYLAALACKEYVVLLPLGWWLMDSRFSQGGRTRPNLWAPLALTGAALLGMVVWIARSPDPTLGFSFSSSHQYLTAQVTVFWIYLGLITGTVPLNLDHHVLPLLPEDPLFWLALGGILSLLLGAFALRRREPLITVSVALFFVFLLPTSSLIPSPDLAFEHRLYAAMLGLAGLVAWATAKLLGMQEQTAGRTLPSRALVNVGLLALLILTLLLDFRTEQRLRVWRDPVRLWSDAQSKSPDKYRPNLNLGVTLMGSEPERARTYLRRALQIGPGQPEAHRSLGQLEWNMGNAEQARRFWERALELDASSAATHTALGQLLASANDFVAAREHLERAITLDPEPLAPYFLLAQLHFRFGFYQETIGWAEKGLQRHSEEAGLWLLLAEAVSAQANWSRAAELYREALRRDPSLATAWQGLEQSLRK